MVGERLRVPGTRGCLQRRAPPSGVPESLGDEPRVPGPGDQQLSGGDRAQPPRSMQRGAVGARTLLPPRRPPLLCVPSHPGGWSPQLPPPPAQPPPPAARPLHGGETPPSASTWKGAETCPRGPSNAALALEGVHGQSPEESLFRKPGASPPAPFLDPRLPVQLAPTPLTSPGRPSPRSAEAGAGFGARWEGRGGPEGRGSPVSILRNYPPARPGPP